MLKRRIVFNYGSPELFLFKNKNRKIIGRRRKKNATKRKKKEDKFRPKQALNYEQVVLCSGSRQLNFFFQEKRKKDERKKKKSK